MSTTEPTTRAEPEMQAYGDYVLTIIDDQPIADGARLAADVRVVVTKNGEPFREFLYPAYRQWTLLAHWTDTLEAPQPEGEEPMTTAHDMSRFQRLIRCQSRYRWRR